MDVAPVLALALALPQVPHAPAPLDVPPSGRSRDSTRVERVYGVPEPMDVETLSSGRFHRHTVITKGRVGQLEPRPGYRGDLGKWLEVEGTLARCGAETCLRAQRVHLGAKPADPLP